MKPPFLRFFFPSIVVTLTVSAAEISMTGATGSVWTDGTIWSDGIAPVAGNNYSVDALALNSPNLANTATATFDGSNLTIQNGTLHLPGSSNATVIHTYSFTGGAIASTTATDPLTAIQIKDGILGFQSTNSTTKQFNARLNFTGASSINPASSAFTHHVNLNRAVTGSGTLSFNWTGAASSRNVNIAAIATTGTAHAFTGDVVLNGSSGPAAFNLNQALGAASYEIRNAWQLNLGVADGLNSASAITVTGPASQLNLNNRGWARTDGVLTINDGTINLGTGTIGIASMSQAGGVINLALGTSASGKLAVSGNAAFSGGSIQISPLINPSGQSFDLITYGGSLVTPPVLTFDSGRLISNVSYGSGFNDKVSISFTGASGNLVWSGSNSDNWDNNSSINFINGGLPDVFRYYDNLLFDDTAEYQTPALVGTISAGTVTFDSTKDYLLGGTGYLVGGSTIIKGGTGTLTLSNTGANTYIGPVTVDGGILKTGTATSLGSAVGSTTIGPGATLEINGQNLGAEIVRISGAGVEGKGAITNSGVAQTNALRFVTLTADATIGGSTRWDLRTTAGLDLAGHTLTKTGDNYIALVDTTVASGDIVLNQGTLALSTTSVVNGTGTLTVNTAGVLEIAYATTGPAITREIVLNGGSLTSVSGVNAANSNIRLAADAAIGGNAGTLNLGGSVTETGGARTVSKSGTSTFIFSGTGNNWSGGTVIDNGIVQVNGASSLGIGPITIGKTDVSAATHSLRLDGTTIVNDIESKYMYNADYFGTVTAVGGTISTVTGKVTIHPSVSAASRGGHLATNESAGSALRLMGELNVAGGQTDITQRIGIVEYGGGASTSYNLQVTGTAKLAADNGIGGGVLVRLGVSLGSTFDLNGFSTVLDGIVRPTTFAANITNSGTASSILTLGAATDRTYGGTISNGTGGISLVKQGASVLTFTGANSYTGNTTIAAGTFAGTGAAASAVLVQTGATLAPGAGVGTFLSSTATFAAGSKFAAEINSATTTADLLYTNGDVTIGTGVTLVTSDLAAIPTAIPAGTKLALIDHTGFALSGTFDGLPEGATVNIGVNRFTLSYADTTNGLNSGNYVTLTSISSGSSPYDTWAIGKGLNGTPGREAGFNADPEKDRIANGLEWILGGNPLAQDAASLVTQSVTPAGGLTLTFSREEDSLGAATLTIEHSTDLSSPWNTFVTVGAAGSGPVTIDLAADPDEVTVTIPASSAVGGKLFGRLKASRP